MKLNKKTAGAVILILLILLLFLSKTIYTYNMPEVTGTNPGRGSLSKLEITSGIAAWAETENIYAVSAGSAGRVFIKEGDYVEKDQILFEMDFDVPATERRFAEINNNISKLEADTRLLQSRLNNIKEALTASRETNIAETDHELSGQAGLIVLEINKAKTLVQNTQFAFEIGFQSRNDLINAENNLQALFYKHESEADDLQHDILLKRMDIENLKLSRETISEILRDYRNNSVVKAPASGVVHELYAERGKFFPENTLLVSIGVGKEFIVECSISLDNNFVNPGDNCELSNASHTLKGTVRRIKPSVQGKTVTITIFSDGINDGETFEITFEKITEASFILVPNSSINQDNDGYFVYRIKRRKGFLGQEYYIERLNIFTGDSDHQNTAVVRGITFFEPIVLVSNKVLSAGQAVLLKNQEDFFEN